MIISLFFAVIASIIYTSRMKYKFIITLTLLILSEFCYQTMITTFVILSILFYIIENGEKRIKFNYIMKLTMLFVIPLLILFLTYIIMKNYGVNINTRWWMGSKNIILNIIIVIYFYCLIYFLYFATSIFAINRFNRKKDKNLNYNLFIMVLIGVIYTLSFLITNSARISCRMAYPMGMLPGLFLVSIAIFSNIKIKKDKIIYILIIVIFFIIEIIGYLSIYNLYIKHNRTVRNNCEILVSYILDYNMDHEENIDKIAIYNDKNITIQNWYSIVPYLDFEVYNSEYNLYCIIKGFYKHLELEYVEQSKEVYNEYFVNEDWEEFNSRQFIVLNNTLHFCKY